MDIPQKLKIGGHEYTVLFPYHFKERSDHAAQHDGDLLEIRVNDLELGGNKRPDSSVMVSFIHEILHGIDRIYCASSIDRLPDNEKIIEGLSEGLYQVLTDNFIK
jgi:hypothetical protein